jgi:hypothetical protein
VLGALGELLELARRGREFLRQLADAAEQDAADAYSAALGCKSNAELDEELAGDPEP